MGLSLKDKRFEKGFFLLLLSFLVLVALAKKDKLSRVSLIQQEQGGCGKTELTSDTWVASDWRGMSTEDNKKPI